MAGVAAYIQQRRLDKAFEELGDPLQRHRKVLDIAFGLGFCSEAHFSRVFRRRFGMSPGEVRAARRPTQTRESSAMTTSARNGGGYEDWLREMSLSFRERAARLL